MGAGCFKTMYLVHLDHHLGEAGVVGVDQAGQPAGQDHQRRTGADD